MHFLLHHINEPQTYELQTTLAKTSQHLNLNSKMESTIIITDPSMAVVSSCLAGIEQPGSLPDQIENFLGQKVIVEHKVCRLDG
jgi:hypothetical protein